MTVNTKELSNNNLLSYEQRKALIKKLSRKMIIETTFSKLTKYVFYFIVYSTLIYSVHHLIVNDHLFHIHAAPIH